MIAVQGSIQIRTYDDRNGNRRYATEIVANNVSFCGSKAETGTQGARPAAQEDPASFRTGGAADFADELPLDDELPF